MNILILTTSPNSEGVKSIIQAGELRGHNMIVKNPKYLYLLISDSTSGYDAVFDGYGKEDKPERLKIRDIDAIISRLGANLSFGCACLEHLNHNLKIFSTQTSTGIQIAANKLISQQKFSQARLRTPKTVLGDRVCHADWMVNQVGGLPAIGKTLTGSLGNGVYILESARQTNIFLQNFAKGRNKLLLQSYINTGNQASDIRAICIDNQVVVAMQRTAKAGEIRANIDKGGSGKKIELSPEDKEICLRACQSVGLQCAGVDLIKDSDGKTFVVEINSNYGYKIETITQTDISTPLIQYCEREAKNGSKANQAVTSRMLNFASVTASSAEVTKKTTASEDNRRNEAKKVAATQIRGYFPFSAACLNDKQIEEHYPELFNNLVNEKLGYLPQQ